MLYNDHSETFMFPRENMANLRDQDRRSRITAPFRRLHAIMMVWKLDPAHITAWRFPHTYLCRCIPCLADPVKAHYSEEGGEG